MTKSICRSLAAVLATAAALSACDRSRPAAPAGEWAPRTVGGLTLSSPGRLAQITTEVPAAMDPAVRAAVQRIDSYGRTVGEVEMRVSRVIYQPTAALSLRGSAQGAVDAVRANPAISRLDHAHAGVQTSGHPAIRTSMRFNVHDRPGMGENAHRAARPDAVAGTGAGPRRRRERFHRPARDGFRTPGA